MHLSALDIAIITFYMVFTLVIGVYFSKKALKSVDQFFVSGRSLPWWMAGLTMIASAFAIDTPLGITGMVARDGIPGLWYAWSFALGGAGALGAFIFSALLRKSEVLTLPEISELRYDGKSAAFLRGFKGVYFGVFANAITLGWIIKAVWTIAETVLPDVNMHLLLITILFITLIYTSISGLWGIAATDIIQFFIGTVGSVSLAVLAWRRIDGFDNIVAGFIERYGEQQTAARLSFFPGMATPFFVTFIVFLTLRWWGNPPPAITQRILASKDEKSASFATMMFAITAFGINYWPMIVAAMVSLVIYPDLAAPEAGYPMLILEVMPSGLLGLMLAALIAAFMSTIDTHLNYGASFIVNDIYRRFIKKEGSSKHYVRASQISTVLMLVVAVFVAYNLDSVSGAWYYMATLTAGYGFVAVVSWFWWRVNAYSEISALAASGVFSTLINPRIAAALGYQSLIPQTFGYRFILIFSLSTVTWVIVSFLTKPVSDAQLVLFCKKVKPYPLFWSRVQRLGESIEWNYGFRRAVVNWVLGVFAIFSCNFGIGFIILQSPVKGAVLLVTSGCLIAVIRKNYR